jgi:hypothetical protein
VASAFPPTGRPLPPHAAGAGGNVQNNKAAYSFTDRQKLWVAAGGNPSKAILAAAVSMAENRSGDPHARHRNSDGSVDVGLWQINSVHGAQATEDPMGNARAAVAISKNGTDWRPWTTFRSGAYQAFLHGSNAFPDPSSDVAGAAGAIAGAVSPIAGIAKFVSRLNVLFELDWWKRVGMVILGLVAILLGVTWAAKEFMPRDLPIPPIIP